MQRAEIEQAFIKNGLQARLPSIDQLISNSVRLSATPVDEHSLAAGSSKIGGQPDLPTNSPWPTFRDQPQAFLAQIRLADIQQVAGDTPLPQQGMLWFFYDASQQTFGEQPTDRAGWHILFLEDTSLPLQRAQIPAELPTDSLFQACALTPRCELTLTLQPALELPTGDWSDEEQLAYERVLEMLQKPEERSQPHHRLLGYPDTIQDDMRIQCQLVSNGITDSDDPRTSHLAPGARDWQLLLQIDSDPSAKMRWANNGMIYYWIRKADLQNRRFTQSWLILQSE